MVGPTGTPEPDLESEGATRAAVIAPIEEPHLVYELVPTVATLILAALVLWDVSFPARL